MKALVEMSETATAVTLAVLNERLDTIEGKLDQFHTEYNRRADDLEQRMRLVERWMYTVPASIITAIASIVYTITHTA